MLGGRHGSFWGRFQTGAAIVKESRDLAFVKKKKKRKGHLEPNLKHHSSVSYLHEFDGLVRCQGFLSFISLRFFLHFTT